MGNGGDEIRLERIGDWSGGKLKGNSDVRRFVCVSAVWRNVSTLPWDADVTSFDQILEVKLGREVHCVVTIPFLFDTVRLRTSDLVGEKFDDCAPQGVQQSTPNLSPWAKHLNSLCNVGFSWKATANPKKWG